MTTLTLRMPDDLGAAVREAADREGVSMNEVLVRAARQYTAGRVRRRTEALDRIATEDAGLLARLGE
jgi:hypothetical protein